MITLADQIALVTPLMVVVFGGIGLLLVEAFMSDGAKRGRGFMMPLTLVVLGVALVVTALQWKDAETPLQIFAGALSFDRYTLFSSAIFLCGAGLAVMLGPGFMREHGFEFGEFYPLVLFATSGMMILGAATDLLTVFLGIETMSLAVYVLTGSWRRSHKSSEAAMKYFLVGAFATAILLYGVALLYGACGSTSFRVLAEAGRGRASGLYYVGMLLVLAAFAFKVAAVPFHMWAPDAYEGAPTPVTAFMAAGVKAAGFAALARLVGTAFVSQDLTFGGAGWGSVLQVLAAATMTVGNLVALRQDNVKRLLAYSSIAHAGYLLLGVVATALVGAEARGPLLYYLLAYTFTTIGAFGVIAWIGSRDDERLQIDDWAGLAWRHPAAAFAMTLFLLSLGGFPPTAGFFGKFYLFRAALAKPGLEPLVVIAVLNSLVSVYYYLRLVTTMYFREPDRVPQPNPARGIAAALLIAAIVTLAIGILPGIVVDLANAATF
jgi:NADH-quinone oxidoreductase subunit N